MKEYKCTLDNPARFVPWLILILVAFFITNRFYVSMPPFMNRGIPLAYFAPALLIVLYISMYLLKPVSINVDGYSITINRKIKPVVIEFSEISTITPVKDMKYTVRTFGNGGIFGYTGKYYKKGIGSMTWYCTQRKNYILIEKTNEKKIVITPDDPDTFMKEMALKNPRWVIVTDI